MNVYTKTILTTVAASVLLVVCSDALSVDDSQCFEQMVKDFFDLKLAITEERTKRAALETNLKMVQDQSNMILADATKRFEIINGQLDQIINGQNVAFNARVSKPIENIQPWATIVFSDVETNIGNGYNSVTGEFTAPVPGKYIFFSNILAGIDKNIETALQVNGKNKMYVYSGGKFYGSGSNMAILHLNAGDVVKMVKHGPWGTEPFYIHPSWSSFSGYLVRADGEVLAQDLPLQLKHIP